MATATSGTPTSSNRIPLNVIHGNDVDYNSHKTSTVNNNGGPYDMRNISDETDRIKIRMKEFEDRCKRWREDFFVKQNGSQFSSNEQRAPSQFTDINNNPTVSHNTTFTSTAPSSSQPPFASTLHKSFIENTEDGGKKYKIEFDIGDFKQNELQISTKGKALIIKGDREVKAGSSTETKTFNRELTVPDYVDLEQMNAFLLDKSKSDNGNFLMLEAPILMNKYTYRRSAFDKSQPISQNQSPSRLGKTSFVNSPTHTQYFHQPLRNGAPGVTSESHHTENKSTSHSHTSSTSNIVYGKNHEENYSKNKPEPYFSENHQKSASNSNNFNNTPLVNINNQSSTPELISGYPVYDNKEGCVVYKFDFSGFDQSEIHLTITVDRTLEIKACRESCDHLGKVYREFKREIQLEPEVDANLIKNLLYEGVLTLKIPKPNRSDGNGSMSNNHNLHSPNGFQEFYNDDGKLARLTSDFKGFSPENVKIVLSTNNVLKLSAHQQDSSANSNSSSNKGTVKRECNRQYTLPSWIQPEQMRAIMSRDGVLTIDFTGKSANSQVYDDRIHIN